MKDKDLFRVIQDWMRAAHHCCGGYAKACHVLRTTLLAYPIKPDLVKEWFEQNQLRCQPNTLFHTIADEHTIQLAYLDLELLIRSQMPPDFVARKLLAKIIGDSNMGNVATPELKEELLSALRELELTDAMAEAFEDLAQENEEVAGEEKGVQQMKLDKAVQTWSTNTVELNGVEVPVIDVVVAVTKVWAKLGLKFFLIFPRFLACSRAFAMGERNIQALLAKVYQVTTKESERWNSGVREAFKELSAALKEVAPPELMKARVLKGDTQLDAKWGVRTMKELIHYGLQHCQSLSLLTPEELAVAECAFGVVGRCRAILGEVNKKQEGKMPDTLAAHAMVRAGKRELARVFQSWYPGVWEG
jgi:hypothetical protein